MSLYRLLKNKTKLVRKRALHRLRIFLKYSWDRVHKEPVFIITVRRTGSNLLLEYLNSIPGVSFAPEVLNKSMFYGLRARHVSKAAALRHIRHSINDCAHRICGGKLVKVHLDAHRITLEDLKKSFPQARFIILYRESLLEQFVSLKIAETTNRWQSTDTLTLHAPIHVDKGELEEYCKKMKAFYEEILEKTWLENCSLVLGYEELAANVQKTFDEKIFPFLGLPVSRVNCRLKKQNTRRLSETIDNYNEISLLRTRSWLWQSYADKSLKKEERLLVSSSR